MQGIEFLIDELKMCYLYLVCNLSMDLVHSPKKKTFSLSQFEDSPVVFTSSFSESEVVLQALFWVVSSWLGVDASGKLTGRELVTELDGREMAQFCERWENVASAAKLVHSQQLLLAVAASPDQLHLHRDCIF